MGEGKEEWRGWVRRKQTYEVELRRAIRKTGVGRGGRHAHYEIT